MPEKIKSKHLAAIGLVLTEDCQFYHQESAWFLASLPVWLPHILSFQATQEAEREIVFWEWQKLGSWI